MQALQSAGHPCVHLFLRRDAMEARGGENFQDVMPLATLGEAEDLLRRFLGGRQGVIVNSAGNSAPDVLLRLWMNMRSSIWIYDVYDCLLYDAKGLKRLQWWLTDLAYKTTATSCCLRSKDLQARYRGSFYSDNASHLVPAKHVKSAENKIVVTASFDRRTDFDFLAALSRALPDIVIDLYGAVYDDDPMTIRQIEQLTAARANIRYYGRFEFDQLQGILDNYTIGLLPYRADDVMTRFISPDKLFHYLCASLEVVASPVPGVRFYERYVHKMTDADSAARAIRRILEGGERRNPGNLHEKFNWRVRAREFCEALEPYMSERRAGAPARPYFG